MFGKLSQKKSVAKKNVNLQMQSYNYSPFSRFHHGHVEEEPKEQCASTTVVSTTQTTEQPVVVTKTYLGNCHWIISFFAWFIALTIFMWFVYYSLKPCWAEDDDCDEHVKVDTKKILLAALVTAIVIILIVWLIYICVNRAC